MNQTQTPIKEIILPPIFGVNSDAILLNKGYIKLSLFDSFMTTRTSYRYEAPKDEEDKLSIRVEKLCNEKSYLKRRDITQIGVGYDNEEHVNFISIHAGATKHWLNMESAEAANNALITLTDWWIRDEPKTR